MQPQKESSSRQPIAGLEISDVQFRFVQDGRDGLVAWVSLVLGQSLALNNLALRRGSDGSLFLTYPAKQSRSGGRFHYFHPITRDTSQTLLSAVLRAANELIQGALTSEGGGGS